MWQISILILYSVSVFFVILFSFGQLALLILFFSNKKKKTDVLPTRIFPPVTIQLPLYNERHVIERLLDAIALIDYPRNKLQIQVLDDSTDDTRLLCLKKIKILKKQGLNISHIGRSKRLGYKAGALQNGLLKANGEFIAIFDADFIPGPDFLIRVLPYFTQANIGLVQTRWGHLNAKQSWLTRVQELALNGHFMIDQQARHQAGLFINFNGTAGIWRKSCIVDAGGWHDDTLTEDLDLSYRAQLRGWKLCYCPEVITPAELPFLLNTIRTQQFRWIKGGIETSKKIIGQLWQRKLTFPVKVFGSFHLLSNYIYLFILLSSILSVPAMFIKNLTPQFQFFFKLYVFFFPVFLINLVYCFTTIWYEKKKINAALAQLLQVFPMAILVSLGMSYHNSTAIFQGIIGKKTPFIRTPKFKSQQGEETVLSSSYYIKKSFLQELPEIILFFYFLFAVAAGIYFRDFSFLPYHFILMGSFGLILYYALVQSDV